MTWHLPDEGCNVSVSGDADDVITISCVNTSSVMPSKPHRYHCALSINGNALMVLEDGGYGDDGIRYYSGTEARDFLIADEVWHELPTFFRNRIVFA